MKVAVAASGPDLDASIDPRFGRCTWFVLVDTDTMDFETLENPGALAGTGAGIAAAQLIADAGAEAIVAGSLGPNAIGALKAGDLKMFKAGGGTVKDGAIAAANGDLEAMQ